MFLNQSAPIGLVLGEGLDDQHMFAEYGRARSGECIKRGCASQATMITRDTLSRTRAAFLREKRAELWLREGHRREDYVWFVEAE